MDCSTITEAQASVAMLAAQIPAIFAGYAVFNRLTVEASGGENVNARRFGRATAVMIGWAVYGVTLTIVLKTIRIFLCV